MGVSASPWLECAHAPGRMSIRVSFDQTHPLLEFDTLLVVRRDTLRRMTLLSIWTGRLTAVERWTLRSVRRHEQQRVELSLQSAPHEAVHTGSL